MWKVLKSTQFFLFLEKEIRKVDKSANEDIMAISCKVKSIDSARFMASLFYKILSITSQKQFIKLNEKTAIFFLNMKLLMIIQ